MCRLIDEISDFLKANGFECSRQLHHGLEIIHTMTLDARHPRLVLPIEIKAVTAEKAVSDSDDIYDAILKMKSAEGYPLIITEDRWKRQHEMMEARLLAHLEQFGQAYARNCEVRRIEKTEAQQFMNENHSYGHAACRYCFGLFLKRHTGHIAKEMESGEANGMRDDRGRLIAVATFSNARKWIKDGKEIRSYEWTRYASIPDLRVSGGMGKLLKAFIKEVQPDDIMSYADLEWSEGEVYERLGFISEAVKEPVLFQVDPHTWKRLPVKSEISGNLFFRNFGSRKFRLKLTDYR
jgi:hypothetical protein